MDAMSSGGLLCFCGAHYTGNGWCAEGNDCPRQELGHGQWSVALQKLEGMSPKTRHERYPHLSMSGLRRDYGKSAKAEAQCGTSSAASSSRNARSGSAGTLRVDRVSWSEYKKRLRRSRNPSPVNRRKYDAPGVIRVSPDPPVVGRRSYSRSPTPKVDPSQS